VGRQKKKALLAHIIAEHNWSQVLVFTRTKYGANHVADFLNKQGITAMALHGNKSQTARTQALAGFKTGELRALVATDIAARGIDIDDLPHVVNYEIPNIPEDYVHRIGRTGRAGASGEAISLVSLDEEGFMKEIEQFTRQQIEVQVIEGFGPEPDEQAEPIAMGRQTLWGGLGKPPSREVMAAAAKAARVEMMDRIREKKQTEGGRNGPRPNRGPRPNGAPSRGPRPGAADMGAGAGPTGEVALDADGQALPQGAGQGPRGDRPGFRNDRGGRNRNRNRNDRGERQPRDPMLQGQAREPREREDRDDDFQPRANAHLGTHNGVNAYGHKNTNRPMRDPDPTRTSIDLMTERRGGGGGGGGNRRRKGGGGGGGGNNGGGYRGGYRG
jgi:ATP-dependent RNA helicase RhlE